MGAGATEANVTRVTAALAEAIRETPAVASGPR
jgi:hypothetical protein